MAADYGQASRDAEVKAQEKQARHCCHGVMASFDHRHVGPLYHSL